MKRRLKAFAIPIWYLLTAFIVLAGLIYLGIARPYMKWAAGVPIDTSYYLNENIGKVAPPIMPYAMGWGMFDVIGGFICLFLGLMCFMLGVARWINKLECKQIFWLALFAALFSLGGVLPLADIIIQSFPPELLFYIHWISFFGYPIALLFHFHCFLRQSIRKWTRPLIFLLIGYSMAAWFMYFVSGLPLDMPDKLYTPLAATAAVLYLIVGIFGAEQKSAAWYIRIISIFWTCWVVALFMKMQLGYNDSLHNEFKPAIILSAGFMMCYFLFIDVRELVGYKSGMQVLEMKHEYLLENYKMLEAHYAQIAQMKHEMRHHLFAIQAFNKNEEGEQLTQYLLQLQGSLQEIDDPVSCDNRVIQSMLGHAAQRAEQMGFAIEFDIAPMPPLSIGDADLVSLLMNLMDNALESCAKIVEPKERWVKVMLKVRTPYLYLSVLNARLSPVKLRGSRYISTKSDTFLHGNGVEVIRKIAAKHGGFAEFEHSDGTFGAQVALKTVEQDLSPGT